MNKPDLIIALKNKTDLTKPGSEMDNSRLVYSTESGRICPSCGNPTVKCTCKKKKAKKKQQVYPDDGVVRIRREVKGRKGKTVTSIFGVPLEDQEL